MVQSPTIQGPKDVRVTPAKAEVGTNRFVKTVALDRIKNEWNRQGAAPIAHPTQYQPTFV